MAKTLINAHNMLIVLSAIVSLSSALASCAEIRQVELDGSMLIDTSPTNYAITSPELLQQHNWRSVSVNGNQVNILTSTCQNIVKDPNSLSQAERTQLTNIATKLIVADSIGNPNGSPVNHQGRRSASRFSLSSGGSMRSSQSEGMSMSSFQSNGISVNKYDEQNYSISKSGLPNGISRLFVSNGDLITFVYTDGRVQMKPIACLDSSESQLFQQLQAEVQQAQRQFHTNMHQMQQNMHQNMMNFQQNMQQMQHNMANMFSNQGFPFNNNGFGNMANQAHAYAGPSFQQQSGAFAGNGAGANSFVAPMAPLAPVAPFGNNFPFGPNNSPFGHNFPFGR